MRLLRVARRKGRNLLSKLLQLAALHSQQSEDRQRILELNLRLGPLGGEFGRLLGIVRQDAHLAPEDLGDLVFEVREAYVDRDRDGLAGRVVGRLMAAASPWYFMKPP